MFNSKIIIILLLFFVASSQAAFFKRFWKSYDEYTKNESTDFTSVILSYVNQTKPWLPGCVMKLVQENPELLDSIEKTE